MFERLQKPFLTVETGEAYQPIRLCYDLHQSDKLVTLLTTLNCFEKNSQANSWSWYWAHECADLNFESIDSYKKNPKHPLRLGTVTVRHQKLYINLPSFKRACLAVPFIHKIIPETVAKIHHADFINKVFGLEERLPHGLTELFKDEELDLIIEQRVSDYQRVQANCELAHTADQAFSVLAEYTKMESEKPLPYAERYSFYEGEIANPDPDVLFLGFYIFLRGRELVAIRRWFGQSGYSLADAAEETMHEVFGEMNIDIIE